MDRDPFACRFGDFTLDQSTRELQRSGELVSLTPRYFDALLLLVQNPGEVISKDRFFDQVWHGVSVSDEALTQAIKDLRKALGDDAVNPTFIKTLPKRGYRFIASVTPNSRATGPGTNHHDLAIAGVLGGAGAGLIGGMLYGLVAAMGSAHVGAILAVMSLITVLVAFLGATGLCVGMAIASRIGQQQWRFSVVGAALGGFITGELFHLLATSSFSLLLGREHDAFTGGAEGLVLGGAIALGAQLSGGIAASPRRVTAGASLGGALAGLLVQLAGGKLMAASLAALALNFRGSQLDLGMFGRLAREGEGSALLQALVGAGEGMLFGAGVVAAIMVRARRNQG